MKKLALKLLAAAGIALAVYVITVITAPKTEAQFPGNIATINEFQSVTAGAGTTFTLAHVSLCSIVTNDDGTNAVDLIINGQAGGTAIRLKAGETLKVGCGDNPPFATSSIRYTAVAGSPPLRITTYELP